MQTLQVAAALMLIRRCREAHAAGRELEVVQLLELAEQELGALVREAGWMPPEPQPGQRVQ